MCNQTYLIRPEKKEDYAEIYTLIKTAFVTATVKDGTEQDFASELRNSYKYIPELALVVERNDGELIAHIMLTKLDIRTNDSVFKALLLAPVSVLLEQRSQKIGSNLIEDSFRRAKSMGYSAVFLCGDPAYYSRFGFKTTSYFGIYNLNGIPEQYVLACELEPDALRNIRGTFDFF